MKSSFLLNPLLLAAVLMFALLTPAHAQEFGRSTIGTVASGGLRADFSRGSKFTMPEAGTLSYLCAYVDGQGGGSGPWQSIRIVLYRDANGVPGTKVVAAARQDVIAGSAPQWLCVSVQGPLVAAGDYWIMIHSGANAGIVRYYYDGPANWYGGADAFADDAADPFGAGGTGSGTPSVKAFYSVTTLGRITTGTVPSGGLRADVSRGSKFTLGSLSSIKEVCAYLDGQGGGSGSQAVRLAVYRDANGKPGAKVGQSVSQAIAAGASAKWTCLATQYLVLQPGDYWLMVHSGGNANVARYYYDGPANWYGGNDAFADDSADTFGPGSTGSGTLSVYATFVGVYHSGRMTVGTIPSGGLRADYRRGSGFEKEKGRAVALSVYMDGLGGGSGSSQQVAFALYDHDGSDGTVGTSHPAPLGFVTKPITIPAGMPPQWITVHVPPYTMDVPGGLGATMPAWAVIHSGSNAGIARFYYDGSGNFCGHADAFSDGTDPRFGTCEPGNGTISAFLSYEASRFGSPERFGNQADPSAATPSGGLSANFLRGSKFTVTAGAASLGLIHAYVDGLGGGVGSQQVQALVYDDSPEHKLVAQSEINTIAAGTQPGWSVFRAKEPARLPPGNYYLMLFTGGNAGVVRNYGTPTPNWTGVSASFSAGPPAKLSSTSATGSVTLLMYAELIVPVDEPY